MSRVCVNGPDCQVCALGYQPGESPESWQARIRELWNAPEAQSVPGPPPRPVVVKPVAPPRTVCQRGHPWTPPRCRVCKRDANNQSRRLRRQMERRQEAVA